MKIIQFLLNNIVAPLVVLLMAPIIIGIASKINTGNWMEWFGLVPNAFWIFFGAVIFLWFIIINIRNRVKQLQNLDTGPGFVVISNPDFGWINIGNLDYAGVVWRIRAPAPRDSFKNVEISMTSIEVEIPPRCPKCETELEQLHSFWGGYIWRCVGCGFQKRKQDSYYQEQERAEKIARRYWEKQEHESSSV